MPKFDSVPGFPGLFSRPTKTGDVTYYMNVRLKDGSYTRRKVGRRSDGVKSPKVAYKMGLELQEDLAGQHDQSRVFFRDAHDNFLRTKQAKGSNVVRDVDRWNLYLSRFASVPMDRLQTSDFQDMLIELRGKGLSEGYLEKIFGQARTYFSWAIKAGLWRGVNPLGRDSLFQMPSWRKNAKPSRWFTPREADSLLEEIRMRSETLYRMSFLSLRTGMRAMEIFGLGGLEDAIDEVNGQLNFIGKSGQREHVYADRAVIELLREYDRRPGEFIFQSSKRTRIIKISRSFQTAVKAAGLESQTHKVWFHCWRHTFGSWLAQSGEFSLQEIMEYMRHTDDRMTRHYARLIPGEKKARLAIIQEKLDAVHGLRTSGQLENSSKIQGLFGDT